jgi:G3E family GTPase
MPLIPVSIITGALGSGKTTLLNYLLTEHHGIRIGVIVNEFGDVGIDSELIVSSTDEMIELTNGCVCCTVRGDLIESVKKILTTGIEYLLIETSGMAEPAPVANTFLAGEARLHTKLDGIITVVDAENFFTTMDLGPTVTEQIDAADVILLNKTDIVPEAQLKAVEEKIWEISPKVFIFRTVFCKAPLNILLATGKFNIDRWLEEKRDVEHDHEHAAGFAAVAISQDSPLAIDEVNLLLRSLPVEIFRAKGILNIGNLADASPEKDMRMVFHKVGKRVQNFFDRPWREGEVHQTKIVLIGTNIDQELWQKKLDSCVLRR